VRTTNQASTRRLCKMFGTDGTSHVLIYYFMYICIDISMYIVT
jgi:hypothetical protein